MRSKITIVSLIEYPSTVNIAAINYHFGSKKTLIEAVFDRFMECFTNELITEMATIERQSLEINVNQVLMGLVRPIIELDKIRPNGSAVFMKLLTCISEVYSTLAQSEPRAGTLANVLATALYVGIIHFYFSRA